MGRTKSDRAEGADKGKGTKRKVIEPKTPHMDFKGPKTRAKGPNKKPPALAGGLVRRRTWPACLRRSRAGSRRSLSHRRRADGSCPEGSLQDRKYHDMT